MVPNKRHVLPVFLFVVLLILRGAQLVAQTPSSSTTTPTTTTTSGSASVTTSVSVPFQVVAPTGCTVEFSSSGSVPVINVSGCPAATTPANPTPPAPPSPPNPPTPPVPPSPPAPGSLAAFPGAQGGGAASIGGRGGVVLEVTNTNASGAGSLLNCVQASGPRTCVFRVAGIFGNAGEAFSPYLTIACQTAPGEVIIGGPTISGGLRISTHDVIVRYCTFSPDSTTTPSGPDSGTIGISIVNCPGNGTLTQTKNGCYNIITDHVTTRWSGNKSWITTSNFTPYINGSCGGCSGGAGNKNGVGPNHNITVQWHLDYEPHEGHPVGYGTATDESCTGTRASANCLSVYETDIDFHHSMFVNVNHRIPENSNGSSRWINNIVYNWGFYANEWLGAEIIDDINNKFIKGNLNANAQAHPIHFTTNSQEMSGAPSVYVAGNIFGGPGATTIAADQYGTLVSQITGENGNETGPIPASWERSAPMAGTTFPIVVDPTANLDTILLSGTTPVGNSAHLDCSGNWVSHQDAADKRIIAQYNAGGPGGFWPNGVTYSGGAPGGHDPAPTANWQDSPITNFTACTESLHDGIPDQWKAAKGLSTTDTNMYKALAPTGYTWLETYLNGN
jgi:pectate lyase